MGFLSELHTWGGHGVPPYYFWRTIYGMEFWWLYASIYPKTKFAWQFSDLSDFRLRRYDVILGQNDVILDQNRLKQQMLIVSVKTKVWTWNLVRIHILMVKIQKYYKNTIIGVPLCIFRKSHCSIVYKQWKTIENNRKTMGTIDFRNFLCANEKYYYFKYTDHIWCYCHQYSPFYGWFHRIWNI